MIRVTQLLHGAGTVSEAVKYRNTDPEGVPRRLVAFTETRRPVVFWNITRKCNLACAHCYISAGYGGGEELTLEEASDFMADLKQMKIPLLMFTGGEPLMRADFWQLAEIARDTGLTTAISTNGTLITPQVAARIRDAGIEYAGVSLDGAREETHDRLRNQPGSFRKAVNGLRNCVDAGLNAGIRITVSRDNYHELGNLLALARELQVPRFCLYWLVPSGRAKDMYGKQMTPDEARQIFGTLLKKAGEPGNSEMEILTVDAPQDGVYLLNAMKESGNPGYQDALTLLRYTGDSCSAGNRVANVDPGGNVYPCQFMQRPEFKIGSVRERKFSELWNDPGNSLLSAFRKKADFLKGRCGICDHRDVCGGGCRIRAYMQTGDLWGEDPLCALSTHGTIAGGP